MSSIAAVVDARVVGDREGDSIVLEVETVRMPVGSRRVRDGDQIVAAHLFSEYVLDSGELTFFLIGGGPFGGEWRVAYVHDRTIDAPVAGFPDRDSPQGATVTEMLECLVQEHRIGEGDDPILRALVAETLEPKLEAACTMP